VRRRAATPRSGGAARLARDAATFRTTLDAGLQRFARDALARHLAALAGRNVEDGAVIVLDNLTGDVLVYVVPSGDLSAAGEVDGITAHRQARSTLKPFLYADAAAITAATSAGETRSSGTHSSHRRVGAVRNSCSASLWRSRSTLSEDR
jgi:membrane peptidoglycan carboxypeptidase